MPFDGTTISGVVHELSILRGGRIDKITQPEPDEIFLLIRAGGANYKVLMTANANAPRLCFTSQSKNSPLTAPMFCMVLRKHLSGGRILAIVQPDFERIVEFHIETLDEMGDRAEKILLIEIMGKHSNIMLVSDGKIVDAIKHVPFSVSMVRQILPGAVYSPPPSNEKLNPLVLAKNSRIFFEIFSQNENSNDNLQKTIYMRHTGIPILAEEICNRANISPEKLSATLSDDEKNRLQFAFGEIFSQIKKNKFDCAIYWSENGKAVDLCALSFSIYEHHRAEKFVSPSEMLEKFYAKRDEIYRISQKTADLRKLITAHMERCRKKSFVHEKTLAEIKNRDELRIKGELLTAYLYMVKSGTEKFTAENFYDNNSPLEITLDTTLSAAENAQKYFKQYNKQKRAFAALQEQILKNSDDLNYLESVSAALEIAENEADIAEIRAELAEQGFAKKRAVLKNKRENKSAKPLKYFSSDGFEIFVGKNNTQNDFLTLRFAKPHDIWFHTKEIAGSHVILVTNGKEPTDAAVLYAANIAAYNSRARDSSNVPVDYVAKKFVKKPAGAKPGYVIYDKHKTVYITPDLEKIKSSH
jgi:predicted ribosome quality control (RQC) complex YloA/Tae2 family protein